MIDEKLIEECREKVLQNIEKTQEMLAAGTRPSNATEIISYFNQLQEQQKPYNRLNIFATVIGSIASVIAAVCSIVLLFR